MQKPNGPAITIVGHVCIDHNTVDGIYDEAWGSAVLYIAKYFQKKHVLRPSLIAPYGKNLSQFVETRDLINPPSSVKSLLYKNTIIDGVRKQAVENAKTATPVVLDDRIKNVLAHTDILILAPLLANYGPDYIQDLCDALPKNAMKVLLPQGYYRAVSKDGSITQQPFKDAAKILPMIDIVIQSDEDSARAGQTAKTWSTEHQDLTVIVTRNKHGASMFRRGQETKLSTSAIEPGAVVNPVGAGDVFSAGLVLSLYRGHGMDKSIQIAQQAAHDHLLGI